jgi:hypothetical protein
MTDEDTLRGSFVSVEVNDSFSEAVLHMSDSSRLVFCHRVGERWARAEATGREGNESGIAGTLLVRISMFRLNGKHLDIQFTDGSRWEAKFSGSVKRS